MVTVAEYNARVAADMLEGVLQERVRQLLILHGWRHYHTYRSKRSPAGFPDTCAVRGDRLLFSELKREAPRHKPSTEQQEWLDDLRTVPGVSVYLWRPSDLLSGRIEEILR